MSDLICVPPGLLDATWPHVSGLIEQAYAEADMVMPDVLGWLKQGGGLLWVASDGGKFVGVLTTSLEERASGRACRMVAAGGDHLGALLGHLPKIEQYAKSAGCVMMVMMGRRGWERTLPDYSVRSVFLEKRLLSHAR